MSRRDGGESRKKRADSAGREPKRGKNGQSAAKPRIEERSTTIPCRSRAKRCRSGLPRVKTGEDIVYACVKAQGVRLKNVVINGWNRAELALQRD